MREEQRKIAYVLFGATGNLAQIKIMPALCALFQKKGLSVGSKIIAFGRRDWNDVEYRDFIRPSLANFDQKMVEEFLGSVYFVNGAFEDAESFVKLKSHTDNNENYFHLAIRPEDYSHVIKNLGLAGLSGNIIIEKPFGESFESAESLENLVETYFAEEKIFRVDHYLGKGGLREIIERKKSDSSFESMLNARNIDSVVCRLREVIDVQGRGEFYDKTGALLDVGQNHALEVIATLLMDINKNQNVARQEIIESLEFVPRSLIRAQYEGYKDEKGVAPDSVMETYFRVGLQSNLPELSGIEIIMEAGKALEKDDRKEEIEISYDNGDKVLFDIDKPKHYNAYEAVIEASFENNKTMFVSKGEMFALWRLADVIKDSMKDTPLVSYKKGSGPRFA